MRGMQMTFADIVEIHYKLKWMTNLSYQTSTFSSLVPWHVGLDFVCMQLWTCYKNEYCTQTPTALFFFQLTSWQQSFPLRLSQWLQGRVGRRQFHHRICVQRTKTWLPYKERKECSARGISLSSEGIKQLNYQVLQQNVLDEIQCPIEKMRPTDIYKPCHIIQTPKSAHWPQSLRRKSMSSCVRKRVIDAWTFKTYPYGCERMINENMDMTELLCHL